MATFSDSTRRFLINCEAGGGPPFSRKIKSQYRVYPGTNSKSKEIDIGVGYMLFDTAGKEVAGRRFWKGIDLHTAILSDQQVLDLFSDVWYLAGNGGFNNAVTRISNECNLNQNQFDALASWVWAYGPYEKIFSRQKGTYVRSATGALFDKIRQHKSNLLAGYNDIQNEWTKYCTTGGLPAPELRPRRMKEFNLFFDSITPDVNNQIFAPTGEIGNPGSNTRENTDLDTLENANENVNLEEVFERIENNTANLELDNVTKSWGSRNSILEQSDWIGLKQFLIYLCSRYYPQNLIPFAELIPVYSLDKAQTSNNFLDTQNGKNTVKFVSATNKLFGISDDRNNQIINEGVKSIDEKNAIQNNYFKSTTGLDFSRYNNTSDKLNNLLESGGIDLLTIDPFMEFSDALNVPNDAGKAIMNQRGYGYKLFSSITLNPSITDGALSKGGGIGFNSIEIESGSAVQNQMSLITIKLTDIQGNKFFDMNSPWSFILNGASKEGGDFYFRYGWQIRVPNATIGSNNNFINKEEENAEKFWNHEGWKVFGKEVKTYILETASISDNTITLTQSTDPSSFKTPGYLLVQETGAFKVQIDRQIDPFKYIPLTLINPEISVDSNDGSVTATLYFRTQSAIANCLTGLSNSPNMYSLFANTNARTGDTTLLDIVTAFIKDNKNYINTLNNKKINNEVVVDPLDARSWIQVIGGATTENQVDVDPGAIPIKVSQKMLGELNRAYQSKDETRLLIEWLNAVLEDGDNGCKILTIGDQDIAGNSITGAMVVAYSKNPPQSSNVRNLSEFETLTVSGSTRLQLQDDVFSFRFQGSLIESLGIEKIESTTSQTNNAIFQMAQELNTTNADNNDVAGKNKDQINKEIDSQIKNQEITFRQNKNISLANKKANLAIIYSQMFKATVRCIAHPWLKIGRPIFIKGNGFYDGKYIITKVTHILSSDNKFISEVDCMRVSNQEDFFKKQNKITNTQNLSLNKPNLNIAEPIKNTVPYAPKNFNTKVDFSLPNPIQVVPAGPNPIVVEKQDIVVNQNAALGLKILTYGINEKNASKELRLPKYKNYIGDGSNITNYDAAYISWVAFKATFDTKDTMPFTKSSDINNILNQFKSKDMFKDFFTNFYIPKKGDLVFWENHIGIVYKVTSQRDINSNVFKITRLETIELVNNDVKTIVRTDDSTDYFTNQGVRILGFGIV